MNQETEGQQLQAWPAPLAIGQPLPTLPLWVATDFGEGSLTTSGYPRIVKKWSRDRPLEEATTIFEGSVDHMSVAAHSHHTPEGRYDVVSLTPSFFDRSTAGSVASGASASG